MSSITTTTASSSGPRITVEEVIDHDDHNNGQTTRTTTTTTTTTAAARTEIGEIHDENVLREMWEESEDPEEKRVLRSKMYKLREDRLKEYYGREGHDILENILNPEIESGELKMDNGIVEMEQSSEKEEEPMTLVTQEEMTAVTQNIVKSKSATKHGEEMTISNKQESTASRESKRKQINTKEDPTTANFASRIRGKDRDKQIKEIRKNVSKGTVAQVQMTGRESRRRGSGESETSPGNNLFPAPPKSLKTPAKTAALEMNGQQLKVRRTEGGGVNGKSSISGSAKASRVITVETNKGGDTVTTTTTTTVSAAALTSKKSSSIRSSTSSATASTSTKSFQSRRIVSSSSSTTTNSNNQSQIKSISEVGQQSIGSIGSGVEIEEIIDQPQIVSSSHNINRQYGGSGGSGPLPKTDGPNKAKKSSGLPSKPQNKSRESSPKRSVGKATSQGTNSAVSTSKKTGGSGLRSKEAKSKSSGVPEQAKTEEKIMRELDILDSYLSQRSISLDEKEPSASVAKLNGTTATTTTTTAKGREEKVVTVDVMESGKEPPFTKKEWKYGCPDENHHERRTPKEEVNNPRGKSSVEEEVISVEEAKELLSRPSGKGKEVSGNRRRGSRSAGTKVGSHKKNSSVEVSAGGKPEPNPRVRKDSSSSPERVSPERKTQVVRRNPQEEEEDDEDDLLRPQGPPKDLDSPGAVLKAKSLFETKAQEAAKDRSSSDFDVDKGLSQSAKVSRKAALFEARSRGERVSVSSDSSLSLLQEEDNNVAASEEEVVVVRGTANLLGSSAAPSVDTKTPKSRTSQSPKREEVAVKSRSPRSGTSPTKKSLEKESTPKRRESRGGSQPSEDLVPISETSQSREKTRRDNRRKSEGRKSPEKTSLGGCETIEATAGLQTTSKTSKTSSRRKSSDLKLESPSKPHSVVNGHSGLHEKSTYEAISRMEGTSNKATQSVKTSQQATTTTLSSYQHPPSSSNSPNHPSNRMTTSELNAVDSMDDLEELERLLEKATDYDERSKIRGRIRALKRKAALVKKSSAEDSGIGGESSPERTSPKRSPSNLTSDDVHVKIPTKSYLERRRSSGEVNKISGGSGGRKKSGEVELKKREEEASSKSRRISREKTDSGRKSPEEPKGSERRRTKSPKSPEEPKGSERRRTKSPKSPSPSRDNTGPYSSQPRRPSGERKLSSETKELLSTRRYSRADVEEEREEIQTSRSRVSSQGGTKSPERVSNNNNEDFGGGNRGSRDSSRRNSYSNSKGGSARGTPEPTFDTENIGTTAVRTVLESVPEVKVAGKDVRKYEADILSRPSVLCARREKSFVREETSIKRGRESVSPQRSEIPISSRVKSKSSDESKTKTPTAAPTIPTQVSSKQRKIEDTGDEEPSKTTSKVSSRKNSSELPRRPSKTEDTTSTSNKTTSKKTSEELSITSKSLRKESIEETSATKEHSTKRVSPRKTSKEAPPNVTEKKEERKVKEKVSQSPSPQSSKSRSSVSKETSSISEDKLRKKQGTESVTSSYGVGPTDDDGAPLFGLRALRKIKQAQEQMAEAKGTPPPSQEDNRSLRSSENFGLRALKKGSTVSRGYDEKTEEGPSVPEGSTRESKSSSWTEERRERSEIAAATTTSSPPSGITSPKSILKKTSSFTSNHTHPSVTSEERDESSGDNKSTEACPSPLKTPSTEDSSWLRKSVSPSPEPVGTFSRGKVGRSSVKEMSRRFETTESSSSQASSAVNATARPAFARADSPSRIPSPIRATTTISTKTSVEVKSTHPQNVEVTRTDLEDVEGTGSGGVLTKIACLNEPQLGGDSTITRITRTKVTKTSTGRSFLTDQSPVVDMGDVLERMKGEEVVEGDDAPATDDGRSLLNKFIGAQMIMQAVEPMLVTEKVSMSSSLVINGVNIDTETDTVKLTQLLAEVDGGDRDRVESRLRILESSGGGGTAKSGESSGGGSSASSSRRSSRPGLTKTLSIAGIQLGGGSTGGDEEEEDSVTGELMPLILGQLASSLEKKSTGEGLDLHGPNFGGGGGSNGGGGVSGGGGEGFVGGVRGSSEESEVSSSSSSSSGGNEDSSRVFDSGTESGEEELGSPPNKSEESAATELSHFMEGLRNSLSKSNDVLPSNNNDNNPSCSSVLNTSACDPPKGPVAPSDSAVLSEVKDEEGLVQQVDKVLSLLRSSLVNKEGAAEEAEGPADPSKGKELVSLIDRLKASLLLQQEKDNAKHNAKESVNVNVNANTNVEVVEEKKKEEGCECREESTKEEVVGRSETNVVEVVEDGAGSAGSAGVPAGTEEKSEVVRRTALAEEMLAWAQNRPPDIVPLPWVNHIQSSLTEERKKSLGGDIPGDEGGGHWKVNRRRRTHGRSHTVGVTLEELAEARKYLEESAYRNSLQEQKQELMDQPPPLPPPPPPEEVPSSSALDLEVRNTLCKSSTLPSMDIDEDVFEGAKSKQQTSPQTRSYLEDVEKGLTRFPRPFVKANGPNGSGRGFYGDASFQPFPERRMTYGTLEDTGAVALQSRGGVKPFRTFSLDTDPSKDLFTKEETVQIAIHQAAIKKQMSQEEERRKGGRPAPFFSPPTTPLASRDFSLTLPKPYASPPEEGKAAAGGPESGGDSGYTEESGSDTNKKFEGSDQGLVVYETSGGGAPGGAPPTFLQQSPPSPTSKRIENVSISLKELSGSSEFPQLQIAITLNTNNGGGGGGASGGGGGSSETTVVQFNNPMSKGTVISPQTAPAPSSSSAGGEKGGANRYKSKNERKKRMKRANTIDIPQPPGFLLHHDSENSEMEDEEDDSDTTFGGGASGGGGGASGDPTNKAKASQPLTYAPFKPKTEGDRKFLAFLEKNNAIPSPAFGGGGALAAPTKPTYNDKFWNNRFFNLKSNFEYSSQGSSPSPSPVMSPSSTPYRPPRSVSELSLTQQQTFSGGDQVYSKPVWASTQPGQLPPQVKSKLHVFEGRTGETPGAPWRSSAPQIHQEPPSGRQPRFVSSSSVYSVSNVRAPMIQDRPGPPAGGRKSVPVEAPPTRAQHQQQPPLPSKASEGVHMVHATATAMEAMQRPGYSSGGPLRKSQHAPPPPPLPPKTPVPSQDRIELPWAKSPAEEASRDSARILTNKAKFEQMSQPELVAMAPPHSHLPAAAPLPPPHLRTSNKASPSSQGPPQIPPRRAPSPGILKSFPTSSVPNVSSLPSNYGAFQRFPGDYSGSLGSIDPPSPKPSYLGTSASFDEAYKSPEEPQYIKGYPNQPHRNHPQFQKVPGSAFARKVPVQEDHQHQQEIHRQRQEESSGEDLQEPRQQQQPQPKSQDGDVEIQTAVVAKVMGKSQQQHAVVAANRMTSLNDDVPQSASRLNNARSNLRNILNQYQAQPGHPINQQTSPGGLQTSPGGLQTSPGGLQNSSSSTEPSPPILRGNLQLNLPPLSKSMSGDSLLQHQTHYRPKSLVVGHHDQQLVHFQRSPPNRGKGAADGISPASISQAGSAHSASPSGVPSSNNRSSFPSGRDASSSGVNSQPQQPKPAIPKQRSLSEFPKLGQVPRNIGVLTIQTDSEVNSHDTNLHRSTKPQFNVPGHHQQQQQSTKIIGKSGQVLTKPLQQPQSQQQQPNLRVQERQQPPSSSSSSSSVRQVPKVLKSYPTSDSLQRTSSGSSIFNRAQSLFLSANESGSHSSSGVSSSSSKPKSSLVIPPSSTNNTNANKSRPKPPMSLPKTHGPVFPKQFEAQMSPDSANKKQREIEAYFRQQQQQEIRDEKVRLEASGRVSKGTVLRKSASHSKIMRRQRSLSDGEEDVDQIFESLFKASAVTKKSGEISVASSSTKSVQKSESVEISSSNTQVVATAESRSSFQQQASSTTMTSSSTSLSARGGGSGLNRFKQMDQQAKANSGGGALFKFTNPGLKASANSAKDILLYWCQCRTREYENVKIENFSSSWCDGLAFCALIHHFFPDAFDYNSLDPRNRRYNFDLAFRIADEKAGIYPLLDSEDMVAMGRRPDWKCVFTYVQSMYQKLKEFS